MNAPVATTTTNPFPGLRPFRQDEEHLFFGRETQVDTMVDKLADTRFLAVVGSSGSGKSSLVNCGLVPALHRGLMASAGCGWRIATMRPGNRPIRALAEALAHPDVLPQPGAEDVGFTAAELVESTLRMSKLGILEAYREALPDAEQRGNLLVVVDQFEELFRYQALATSALSTTMIAANEDAIAFVNLLLEMGAQRELPIYVVLTMRSDFLGDCAHFFSLPEAISRGQYLVPRMSRDQRRAAIEGPLAVCGVAIEPVLLTRLVNDVGDNPDQLSILQHALNRTWARWRDEGATGPLALRDYEAVGTMAHALNQHAEEAYAQLGDQRSHALCEALFKAITDKSTDARGTRRPTRIDTLCAITGATLDELAAVMKFFRDPVRAFLMPPDKAPLSPDTPVDISHESLMRVWDRLRAWGDEEARASQMYRRLAETAELQAAGSAGLLGSPELQVALDWRARQRPNAAWAERYRQGFAAAMAFLDTSARDYDEAQSAESSRREEVERLRAAEAQTQLNKRWRRFVVPIALVALLVMGFMTFKARQETQRAFLSAKEAMQQSSLVQQQASDLLNAVQSEADARLEAERVAAAYKRLDAQQEEQAIVIAEVRKSAPELITKWQQTVANKSQIYLQYADERQKVIAERLQKNLDASGFSAPGIEKVRAAPQATELRYFRKEDEEAAHKLATQLQEWGAGNATVKYVRGFESGTRLRQLELWLARPNEDDVASLAQQLDSPSKEDRLAAGQILQSRHTASPEAIAAVLALGERGRIDTLSTLGRINALYFLSRTVPSVWTPELERRGRDVVEWIIEQEKSGMALGPQTRAEVKRFVVLLDAVRSGSTLKAAAE